MNRVDFHHQFKTKGPVILPVIHVLDADQTSRNIDHLIKANIPGCFLINHDFDVETFLPILKTIRADFPSYWIGLNFLAVTGKTAFPILAELQDEGYHFNAYWADDARIDERVSPQIEADEIAKIKQSCGWKGLYFGGTAFKKQRPVDPAHYAVSAQIARGLMDVVTTSGIATGNAAELSKIHNFRKTLPDTPLALASGITPENATDYHQVDCFMVATGINYKDDFYNIDPEKLQDLIACCKKMEDQV